MSRKRFIDRYAGTYDRDSLLRDLSDEQKQNALRSSLEEWSQVWPLVDANGDMRIIGDSRYAVTPFDFISATYRQFALVRANSSQSPTGLIEPTINNLYQRWPVFLYDTFGSQLGATNYPPGYDSSWRDQDIPVTQDSNGRYVLDLEVAAASSNSIEIFYNAIHQIEDEGKQLVINLLPNNNDTIVFAAPISKTYTLKTTASLTDDIEIQADVYQMASKIANRLYQDKDTVKVMPYLDVDKVLLRPLTLGATIATITVDGTRIASSVLAAISTLPQDDHVHVFSLMLYHGLSAKARSLARLKDYQGADWWQKQADNYYSKVKPLLHVARL